MQIIIRRPNAKRATVRCRGCGNTFTINVPAPKAPKPDPLFTDFGGDGIPAPTAPPTRAPLPPRRPASQRPSGGPTARSGPRRSANRWVAPVLIGTGLLIVTAASGVGVWMLLAKTSILPSTVSIFDSPRAILDTANANDLELQRLVNEFSGTTVPPEKRQRIEELSVESMRLITRAVLLAPISDQEARALGGDSGTQEEANETAEGPLSESDKEAMRDKIQDLPESERMTMRATVGAGLNSNAFVREYLRFGHLELPSSGTQGEQIKVRQIELLRELNEAAAKVVMKIEPDYSGQPKTDEEFTQFLDEIYEPILDHVGELAEKMHDLAAKRYQVPKDQVGDPDQFDEIMYYTEKAQGRVLVANVALIRSKAKIVEPLSEFLTASKDVDRASVGLKPKRIAAAEEEQQRLEEERLRKEQERKDRIASQERERDEQLRKEKQLADSTRDKLAMNSTPQETSDRSTGEQPGNDPTQRVPGFGPRLGSRFGPGGMSDGRFGPMFATRTAVRTAIRFWKPWWRSKRWINQRRSPLWTARTISGTASWPSASGHRTWNGCHDYDGRYQFGRHIIASQEVPGRIEGREGQMSAGLSDDEKRELARLLRIVIMNAG